MNIKDKTYLYEGVVVNPRVKYKLKGIWDFKNLFNKKHYAHWQKHFPRQGMFSRLKFTMEDTDGVEIECAVKNPYVKLYTDDRVTLICSKETDLVLRVINKSKGKAWSEAYHQFFIPKSNFMRKLNYHASFLVGYAKALFRSIPIINIFDVIYSTAKTKTSRLTTSPKHYVLLSLAAMFYLIAYIYPFNATSHLYNGKPTTYTEYPYQFSDVFDKGPSRLHHLIESGTIVKKSEDLKYYLKPLNWLSNTQWLLNDQRLNTIYAFYQSEDYNHQTDYTYVKISMLIWLLFFTGIGFIFHGAFLTVQRREVMRNQIALDNLTREEVEATAFLYHTQ